MDLLLEDLASSVKLLNLLTGESSLALSVTWLVPGLVQIVVARLSHK